MPRGATRRRPLTVAALLDAAWELFAERGFGATSIPDLCVRAGLTKGAFYSNFENKEELFLSLLDRSWERRAEWLRATLAGSVLSTDVSDDDRSFARDVDRTWTLVSTEFTLYAIRNPSVARRLIEHELRVRSELAVLLAEGLERVGRRPLVPIDDLARLVVAATEGSDLQILTDRAAGRNEATDLGTRAVAALLRQCSDPAERPVGAGGGGPS